MEYTEDDLIKIAKETNDILLKVFRVTCGIYAKQFISDSLKVKLSDACTIKCNDENNTPEIMNTGGTVADVLQTDDDGVHKTTLFFGTEEQKQKIYLIYKNNHLL